MKKILAILFAVMLLTSLTVTALATSSESSLASDGDASEPVADSPAVSDEEEATPAAAGETAAASTGARYTGPVQNVVTVSTNVNDPAIKAATEYAETEEFQGTDEYKAAAEKAEAAGFTSIKLDKIFKVNASVDPVGTVTEVTMKAKNVVALFHFVMEDGAVTGLEEVAFEASEEEFTFKGVVGDVYGIILGEAPVSEETGESTPYALIVAAIVLAAGAVVFFYKSRKVNA